MDKFTKKLYYKLYDMFQFLSFLGNREESEEIKSALKIISLYAEKDWKQLSKTELLLLNIPLSVICYIQEFQYSGNIDNAAQLSLCINDWIRDLILPGYFDNNELAEIINKESINTQFELREYVKSNSFINKYGIDASIQYDHLIKASDWSNFPYSFNRAAEFGEIIIDTIGDLRIRGNFHNHTTYSDGDLSIEELISLANEQHREYIGISDHSKRVKGINEEGLITQIQIINQLNTNTSIRIFKSIECEILNNGTLDLSTECLKELDYVIVGIHSNANQPRKEMESRLMQAIENPFTNILAHPSARILKKKPPVNINMYKILDACIHNNVVIEINGDPSRLDLDPQYIDYAVEKGAYFSLDSDTHSKSSFFNINNAILIARSLHIPPERCINTFSIPQLEYFFRNKTP